MGNVLLSAAYLLIILSCVRVSCKEGVDCENVLNMQPEDLVETRVKGNKTDEGLTLELTGYSGIYVRSVRFIFYTTLISTYKNLSYICLHIQASEIRMLLNETLQTSISLGTNRNVPIGVFLLNTTCYYGGKGMVDCGHFMFLKDMIFSPLFMSFPLQEEFWLYLNDESIFRQDWIRELVVWSNMVSIPSSWISHLRLSNLEELALVGNTWEHPENLLGCLPRLRKLYLLSNGIVTLPNDLFKNIPSIKVVNLMKNKLESLPHGMSNVKKLDLSYQSSVLSISDEVVSSLQNITSLVINTHIKANITNIFRLPHLHSLSCRGCWIHELEIPNSHPWNNDQLLVLDLGSNNLSSLPRLVFEKLTTLSTLSLDNNLFVDCPCSLLNSINSLQHLNFSKNSLSEIQPYCFSGLRNLTTLDLSWNKLDVLKNSTFENVKNLQYLNLSHNFLSSIQEFVK
ncbi:leucine-rich repeat-containing protein 15 [Anabrus simplex]|uniref:leucine-rich repeat-containing protein 15 n=1 Tax=Anabrus simplex TaxID=316456 RepID=UPI0035A27A8A